MTFIETLQTYNFLLNLSRVRNFTKLSSIQDEKTDNTDVKVISDPVKQVNRIMYDDLHPVRRNTSLDISDQFYKIVKEYHPVTGEITYVDDAYEKVNIYYSPSYPGNMIIIQKIGESSIYIDMDECEINTGMDNMWSVLYELNNEKGSNEDLYIPEDDTPTKSDESEELNDDEEEIDDYDDDYDDYDNFDKEIKPDETPVKTGSAAGKIVFFSIVSFIVGFGAGFLASLYFI